MSVKRIDLSVVALGALALLLTLALAFVFMNILNQSEEHIQNVRKTNVSYTEAMQFRSATNECDRMVKEKLKREPTATVCRLARLDISDTSMSCIGKMQSLQSLDLSESTIDDRSLRHIEHLPLHDLNLFGTNISDRGVQHIAKIKTLRSLNIGATQISDEAIEQLSSLVDLEVFRFCATKITDKGFQSLARLRNIRQLDVSDIPVSEKSFRLIGSLPKLESIDLGGVKVTARDIEDLRSAPCLRHIILFRSELNDAELHALSELKGVRTLQLSRNPFTNNGVAYLGKMTNLINVSMLECPNVSPGAVAQLKKRIPGCQIEHSTERLLPKLFRDR